MVAWGRSDKAGDQEFVAGQQKAMREFDMQLAAATGPGSASMAPRSAMATIAPPKLAKVADVSDSVATALTDSRLTAGSQARNQPGGNRLGYGCAVAPTWATSSGTTGSRSY